MINPTDLDLASLPQIPLDFYPNLPAISGLYFCSSNTKILYIGITKDLNQRWRSHHKIYQLSQHENTLIHWLPLEPEQLTSELEQAFIKHWEPLLNGKRHKPEHGREAQTAIAKDTDFNLEAYRVLTLLVGKIGWGNWVEISQREIADELGMLQPNVSRTIKFLQSKNIVEKITTGRCNKLRLNPDYWMRGNPTQLHRIK